MSTVLYSPTQYQARCQKRKTSRPLDSRFPKAACRLPVQQRASLGCPPAASQIYGIGERLVQSCLRGPFFGVCAARNTTSISQETGLLYALSPFSRVCVAVTVEFDSEKGSTISCASSAKKTRRHFGEAGCCCFVLPCCLCCCGAIRMADLGVGVKAAFSVQGRPVHQFSSSGATDSPLPAAASGIGEQVTAAPLNHYMYQTRESNM